MSLEISSGTLTNDNGTFTIKQVTVADGAELAATNIPAFWADPHWRLEWRHRTPEYHISQVALRYPRNLLRNRTTARHEKAVDTATGKILGYARWTLPASHAIITTTGTPPTNSDDITGDTASQKEANGTPAWPEALVPAVPAEEEVEINRVADSAVWDPNCDSDPLLDNMRAVKNKIEASLGKPYMTLDYLAVHPTQQRRGVATALVRSGMHQAEKLGLDIFVHAMKPGVPVYQRLGFQLKGELIQDDSEYGGPGLFGDYFLVYEQPEKSSK